MQTYVTFAMKDCPCCFYLMKLCGKNANDSERHKTTRIQYYIYITAVLMGSFAISALGWMTDYTNSLNDLLIERITLQVS